MTCCVRNAVIAEESEAWEEIREIEKIGVLKAISTGVIQSKIHESAYLHEKLLQNKERTVVGVNQYQQENYEIPELLKIPDNVGEDQIQRLRDTRSKRDQLKVDKILSELVDAAKEDDNLFPLVIDAVRARASLGEITNALVSVFGRYKPTFTL